MCATATAKAAVKATATTTAATTVAPTTLRDLPVDAHRHILSCLLPSPLSLPSYSTTSHSSSSSSPVLNRPILVQLRHIFALLLADPVNMLPSILAHLTHDLHLSLHLLTTRPLLSHVHSSSADVAHATTISMLPLPLPGFAYPVLHAPWLHAVPLLAGDRLRVVDVVGAAPRDAARALKAAAEHCGRAVDTLAVDAETVVCFAVIYDVALLDRFALTALHVRFDAVGGEGGTVGMGGAEEEEEEEEWQQQTEGMEEEVGDTRQNTDDERHAWDYEYHPQQPQQPYTYTKHPSSKAWQQHEKDRFECDCVKRLVSAHIDTLSSLALHNVPHSGAFFTPHTSTFTSPFDDAAATTPPALPLLAYIAASVGDMTQLAQLSVSTRPPGGNGGDGERMRRKAKRRVMRLSTTTTRRDGGGGRSAREGNSGRSVGSISSSGYYEGRTTRQAEQQQQQQGSAVGDVATGMIMMREETQHRNNNNDNDNDNRAADATTGSSSSRAVPRPSSSTMNPSTTSSSSSSSACTSPSPPPSVVKPSQHNTNPNSSTRNQNTVSPSTTTTTTTTTHNPLHIHPHFHFHHHNSSSTSHTSHATAKRHPPYVPSLHHSGQNPLVAAFIAMTCAAVTVNNMQHTKLCIRYTTPPAWRLAQRLAKAVRITTRDVHISADDHGEGHHTLTWKGLSPRSPLELVVDDYVLMAPALQMTGAFVRRHERALGLAGEDEGMQRQQRRQGAMMMRDGGAREEEERRRRAEERRRETRIGRGRGRGQRDALQQHDVQRGSNNRSSRREIDYNNNNEVAENRHSEGRERSTSHLQLWPRVNTTMQHRQRERQRSVSRRGSGSWSRLRDFGSRLTTGLGLGRGRNGSITLRRNEDGVAYGDDDEEEECELEEMEEEQEYEDDDEVESREFEYEADDMSMLPRFVRVNRTDVAVLSGLRGQVGLQSIVQFLQLIYPSVTTTTTPTPITTNIIAGTPTTNTNPNNSPSDIPLTIDTPTPTSSSWPFLIPSPSPDTIVPIIRAWPQSVAHVVSYTRLILSVGCAIPGKVFLVDASASFMRELSRSPSVLRALLRRSAAVAVRGEIDLWVVLAMLRALNDVDRRQNRLRGLHVERGAKTMMGDCSDMEVAKIQIEGLAEEIEMTWPGIDLMSVRQVMERDF